MRKCLVDRLEGCLHHALGDRGRELAGNADRTSVVIAHGIGIPADLLVFEKGITKCDIRVADALGDISRRTDHGKSDTVGDIDRDAVHGDRDTIDIAYRCQEILETLFARIVLHDNGKIEIGALI